MRVLAIETSCDETSASIGENYKDKIRILSNVISSSISLYSKTGGIVPEIAAREQIKYIIPVIEKAILKVGKTEDVLSSLDAIAVTHGPGLIGSLLVGVETAKSLSFVFDKPLIPVNHLIGHIYANFIGEIPNFPAVALVVSGGHTDLVLMKNHGKIQWLGGTRDDACGEAFDKIGRLLNLPYPGGPYIEKNAKEGNHRRFNLPRPMLSSKDFDFSFSGLKTAVQREVSKLGKINEQDIKDLSASVQDAIFEVLIYKTISAAEKYKAKSILLGGGVASNDTLKNNFELEIRNLKLKIKLFVPTKSLCTDNAAMIASAAILAGSKYSWKNVEANPELYFE